MIILILIIVMMLAMKYAHELEERYFPLIIRKAHGEEYIEKIRSAEKLMGHPVDGWGFLARIQYTMNICQTFLVVALFAWTMTEWLELDRWPATIATLGFWGTWVVYVTCIKNNVRDMEIVEDKYEDEDPKIDDDDESIQT